MRQPYQAAFSPRCQLAIESGQTAERPPGPANLDSLKPRSALASSWALDLSITRTQTILFCPLSLQCSQAIRPVVRGDCGLGTVPGPPETSLWCHISILAEPAPWKDLVGPDQAGEPRVGQSSTRETRGAQAKRPGGSCRGEASASEQVPRK